MYIVFSILINKIVSSYYENKIESTHIMENYIRVYLTNRIATESNVNNVKKPFIWSFFLREPRVKCPRGNIQSSSSKINVCKCCGDYMSLLPFVWHVFSKKHILLSVANETSLLRQYDSFLANNFCCQLK